MKNFLYKNKWIISILILSLLVRLIYFLSIKSWEDSFILEKVSSADASEYQLIACKIIENGGYPSNIYLDIYRTPVFPLYIALFYLIFGIKPFIVLFSYVLLNAISVMFLYLLCKKIFNNNTIALIASAFYALEPNIIKLTTEFGTETLHATLLIISVYYFIAGLKDKKNYFIIISAVFFGITALTRPISLYFYLICLLSISFYPRENVRFKLKYIILFISFYFISIAPWMYRNYVVYNHFSSNAFQGNAVLFNAGVIKSYETGIRVDSTHIQLKNELDKVCKENNITNPFEIDKQKQILGYNYLINHLDIYLKYYIKGMLNFFISPLNNPRYSVKSKIFVFIYFLFIYSLSLIGIYKLIKDRQYYYLLFLLVLIFYFCFFTGNLGVARYRAPTTAFYIILSSYATCYFLNNVKKKFLKNKI